MLARLRRAFNDHWTEAQHAAVLERLTRELDGPVPFPISETPCFFSRAFMRSLADTGVELIEESLQAPALDAATALTPAKFRGPKEGAHPAFIQVDFGLIRTPNDKVEPRLVELQAFPSLYGFQLVLAETFREVYPLLSELGTFLDAANRQEYLQTAGEAILNGHRPSDVVLLEIDPERQKTRPDFVATERLWGVRAIDIHQVKRDGRNLWYSRDGKRTPIARIYNRVIPDELERAGRAFPFAFDDELDVEWGGHPAWFFRLSKASIPSLQHPSVPRTWRVSDLDTLPDASERLLIKPLFSFAGGGILFDPTDNDLRAIPPAMRDQFIVQERIQFAPVIETPHGPTQAEIRIMFVWTDRLRPVLALVRMGRGRMMGVDHNKGLRWVGASAALISD